MVNRHTKIDPDFKDVVLQAISEIIALYNSLRKTGGKGYVSRSGKLMEGFRRWVPRCRKSLPEEYQEFSEFMEAFRECINARQYQYFIIKRGIIDTNNFQYKFGKKSIRIGNDEDASISFYIKEINSIDNHEAVVKFYDVLTSTGGKLLDADNEFVSDLKYSGVVSFLDFVRLTFIYYQIIYGDFQHIRVCKLSDCNSFFYSQRLGEKRWQYCSHECRNFDLPADITDMRNCQRKMRTYYQNQLDRYSNINCIDDISYIKLSFVDDLCSECKYKSNPKQSKKGDCHQALSRPEIVRIVDVINKNKQEQILKKSVK
jgi:hypothetical protein